MEGSLGQHIYYIAHGILFSEHASLDGREVWGRIYPCICMVEPLYCLPETTTTLLIDYTPTQNKKFKD